MSPLSFDFTEMAREVTEFSAISGSFFDPDAVQVLQTYGKLLDFIRSSKKAGRWQIAQGRPLRTRLSDGEYEGEGRKGKFRVVAEISSVWQIDCVNENNKKGPPKAFHVTGLASTTVCLMAKPENRDSFLLSRWQVDLGDENSPGCHFHIQVQQDSDEHPFSNKFPIPRFPSMLITPLAVAEFVVCELFQTEWPKHISKPSPALQTWTGLQKGRMRNLLSWQQATFESATTSPWTFYKGVKPESSLFVR